MKRKMMLMLCVSGFLFGTGLTHQASEAGSKAGITFSEGDPKDEPPGTIDSEPAKELPDTSQPDTTKKVISQAILPKTNEKPDGSAIAVGLVILLGTAVTIKRRDVV
ncbi:LPXTG cell wall anchor domain-containing protein [Vagococcus sp. BWB3-3]|uniref:LPXTG cell wall anchor domain-containing protein n=1 Tax=Vagococcus allomyrinae TaxID=2794353 RepID=A0A940SWW5_9ENTE|nr:LPXTG cell wall anchor domain-containing protein [Vagococcus allomyrinae]